MKIPKQVTIGQTPHLVRTKSEVMVGKTLCRGSFDERDCTITIGRKYTPSEKSNTFWHELTHAILHDMGEDKLNHNEQFVSDFADRLDQAIKTAKF